jgi:hypothetical protein
LSSEADANLSESAEKATDKIFSVCVPEIVPSNVAWPESSSVVPPQICTVVSHEAEAIKRPSGEKATEETGPECPVSVSRSDQSFIIPVFQILAVLSDEPSVFRRNLGWER